MTVDDIKSIIAQGEGLNVELKHARTKSVILFMNLCVRFSIILEVTYF